MTLTLDITGNDPRYGPRRSRYARSRYHSRRHGSSLNALSRRDRRVLHDLLLRCRRRRAQPPIGAHVVPFFRQKKRRSCIASLETQGHPGMRKLDTDIHVSFFIILCVVVLCIPTLIAIMHHFNFPARREGLRDDFHGPF